MKTIIVYATKYGCTKKCAEILKTFLKGEIVVLPVRAAYKKDYNLQEFDNVIIGGSVYMGKIQKELISFWKHYKKVILKKKLGIFVSCYTENGTAGFFESLFPNDLLQNAIYVTSVGGEMNYKKMNFAYRKLFQMLKKIDGFNEGFKEPSINVAEIQKLADLINKN